MSWSRPPLDLQWGRLFPLAQRRSLTVADEILVDPAGPSRGSTPIGGRMDDVAARMRGPSPRRHVMLIYGAHLLRNGAARILERMMAEGWLTHLATNGAGTIHDWEYAWLGRSTESVRDSVAHGCFGTWDETGRNIHRRPAGGRPDGEGYGRGLGRFIAEDGVTLPDARGLGRGHSPRAARIRSPPPGPNCCAPCGATACLPGAYAVDAPLERGLDPRRRPSATTCRSPSIPGIGYDIIATHPMFNGAAIGRAGQRDFAQFAARSRAWTAAWSSRSARPSWARRSSKRA